MSGIKSIKPSVTNGLNNKLYNNSGNSIDNKNQINNRVETYNYSFSTNGSNLSSNGSANNIELFDMNSGSKYKSIVGKTGKISGLNLDFSKIADNYYDAANGNFLDEKSILKEYWTDGSDLDYKIEDGNIVYLSKNGVPMGRTTLDSIKNFININDDVVKNQNIDFNFYSSTSGASDAALGIDSKKNTVYDAICIDGDREKLGRLAVDNSIDDYLDALDVSFKRGKISKSESGYEYVKDGDVEYRRLDKFNGQGGPWHSIILADGTEYVFFGYALNTIIKDNKQYRIDYHENLNNSSKKESNETEKMNIVNEFESKAKLFSLNASYQLDKKLGNTLTELGKWYDLDEPYNGYKVSAYYYNDNQEQLHSRVKLTPLNGGDAKNIYVYKGTTNQFIYRPYDSLTDDVNTSINAHPDSWNI